MAKIMCRVAPLALLSIASFASGCEGVEFEGRGSTGGEQNGSSLQDEDPAGGPADGGAVVDPEATDPADGDVTSDESEDRDTDAESEVGEPEGDADGVDPEPDDADCDEDSAGDGVEDGGEDAGAEEDDGDPQDGQDDEAAGDEEDDGAAEESEGDGPEEDGEGDDAEENGEGQGEEDGEGEDGSEGGDEEEGDEDGEADTFDVELQLVPIIPPNPEIPIEMPHEVYLLDTATGEPPAPVFEDPVMTEAGTGKLRFTGVPAGVVPSYYVVGSGTTDEDTYDAVTLNVPPGSEEPYLRISTVGLAQFSAVTGDFTPDSSRAFLEGTVYHTPGGAGTTRMGTVACAQVFLDGSTDPIDEDSAQRYTADNGLPTRPEDLDQTIGSGMFAFGNLSPGAHTIRVSLDGGETFVVEQEFHIPRSREDSLGPAPEILYRLGVDSPVATPESCEAY